MFVDDGDSLFDIFMRTEARRPYKKPPRERARREREREGAAGSACGSSNQALSCREGGPSKRRCGTAHNRHNAFSQASC